MLQLSRSFETLNLHFQKADLNQFKPDTAYDVVFSNAALQWVGDHETLFPKLLKWVAPQGQVAIQVPYNFDHPSHLIAADVAVQLHPHLFKKMASYPNVLPLERYAEILFKQGFSQQECLIRVYGHPMDSGRSVLEWTKGTLLTRYQSQLSPADFDIFVKAYAKALMAEIGEGPYFYGFKRMLLWGKRD